VKVLTVYSGITGSNLDETGNNHRETFERSGALLALVACLVLSALAALGVLLWRGLDVHVLVGSAVSAVIVGAVLIGLGLVVLFGSK
jgi:hypothetical protein